MYFSESPLVVKSFKTTEVIQILEYLVFFPQKWVKILEAILVPHCKDRYYLGFRTV